MLEMETATNENNFFKKLCVLQLELFRLTNDISMKTLQLCRIFHKRRQQRRRINSKNLRIVLALLAGLRKGYFDRRLPSEDGRMWVRPRSSAWWDDVVPQMNAIEWKENFRISKTTYELLCQQLAVHFHKKDTKMRRSIPLRKRIAMCLYMLYSSSDYESASHKFGVGKSTLWEATQQFCACVCEQLSREYIIFPTGESLRAAVSGFSEYFGFPPCCLGAVAVCHFPIPPSKRHSTEYLNTDEWHSISMLAACDYALRFIFVDVGHPGSRSDHEIFVQSHLLQLVSYGECGAFNCNLRERGMNLPLTLLSPGTFPLLQNTITPYTNVDREQTIFNQMHKEGFGIIEDAIRRVRTRFPIVAKKVEMKTENFQNVVLACCVLHNMCEIVGDTLDWPVAYESVGIRLQNARNFEGFDQPSNSVRDALAKFFDEGAS